MKSVKPRGFACFEGSRTEATFIAVSLCLGERCGTLGWDEYFG